jgi:hypothetical protein
MAGMKRSSSKVIQWKLRLNLTFFVLFHLTQRCAEGAEGHRGDIVLRPRCVGLTIFLLIFI